MFATTNLKTESALKKAFLLWKDSEQKNQQEVGEFLTLGRDSANVVSLEDSYVSSRHARIEKKASGFFIKDMRSRNGTYVNGAKIQEAELRDGDRVLVGQTEFRFVSESSLDEDRMMMSSHNLQWSEQLSRIPTIAQSDLSVLLLGPSGTGKEVLAKMIHDKSSRRMFPMVCVNCSALSESLVESELFGHVKGSFTGATVDRKGAFEAARGGTLFLDEVGDLPLSLQPKLLRALENQQIRPVGSDRTVDTNVRIIAATHQNLRDRVASEKFRADLYFRLNVVQLNTPALVDRMEDFDSLFYYFARQLRIGFSFAAIQKLKEHSWPGNIRELRNTLQRAKAFFGGREIIEADVDQLIERAPTGFSGGFRLNSGFGLHNGFGVSSGGDGGVGFGSVGANAIGALRSGIDGVDAANSLVGITNQSRNLIKEIELEMIVSRLRANRGNQRQTAVDLGIPKSTLHDRIKAYGIDVEQFKR